MHVVGCSSAATTLCCGRRAANAVCVPSAAYSRGRSNSSNGDASQLAESEMDVGDLRTNQSKARLYAKDLLGLSKCLYVIEC